MIYIKNQNLINNNINKNKYNKQNYKKLVKLSFQ